MTYVVDTHALVWFLEGNPALGVAARHALGEPTAHLVVPTIVLAEITFLYAKHRIATDVPAVLARVAQATNCTVYPLDEAVVEHLPTTLNIHDAIIVSTAIVFRDLLAEPTNVVTKDSSIASSGLIAVTW